MSNRDPYSDYIQICHIPEHIPAPSVASRGHSSACGQRSNSAPAARMEALELGDLGANVGAPLDQRTVARGLLLRPLPRVGAEGRELLQAPLDHGQLGVEPLELRGTIHGAHANRKGPTAGQGLGPRGLRWGRVLSCGRLPAVPTLSAMRPGLQ